MNSYEQWSDVFHQVGDENVRLSVPDKSLLRYTSGPFNACRGCVDVTDRTTLCSLARMLNR